MRTIKKVLKAVLKVLCLATAGVAIYSAFNIKTDKEVGHKQGLYERFIKRPFDFFCSMIAIITLSPLLVILAITVKAKLGSPILFKQKRPGRNEVIFELYKFRTMTDERDSMGNLLPDSMRLTKFGHMLRLTSLDELPELINIIKGDMAIIGPRPLAVQYLPYYNEIERQRHSVRPGLSGLAQINGRTAASWDKRFEYDVEYVKNISFREDMRIIIETIKKVLKRADVVEAGSQGDFDKYRINQLDD